MQDNGANHTFSIAELWKRIAALEGRVAALEAGASNKPVLYGIDFERENVKFSLGGMYTSGFEVVTKT